MLVFVQWFWQNLETNRLNFYANFALNLLVRATASILLKDSVYFTHTHTPKKKKKPTISILHHHFFQSTNINPSITHYILYKLYFYILFLILFYLCHFFFLILPHLSSSFFCLISLSFPLSFSSSSFFFFLSQSDQHSITSTTTIKTHKHHQSPSTHKHLSTPPASIHIIGPHVATVMKSPLQSTIH